MIEYHYLDNKDLSFNVTDETLKVTPHTFHKNNTLWENQSINYFYKDIPKDKPINIVDIGAQTGLYSLYAKFLPNSTFYSFEPFPQTFKILNDNIKLNNILNIKTFNIALSDKKQLTTLNTCKSHNGLHTMGNNVQRFNDIEKLAINTDTLDNLFYHKNIPVHYIKIDTEGWEYFILLGGIHTIQKYKPKIQMEFNLVNLKQCNVQRSKLYNLIDLLGYKMDKIIDEELYLIPNN